MISENNQQSKPDKPKITVIIPIYNGEKYVEQAINSVISQSYENWELILIDDGSTDNSLAILKRFSQLDNRINVITQKNSGQSAARNRGASIAKGKYLSFLDQDDYFSKRHLEQLVMYMNSHEDIGMAYSDAEIIDETGDHIFNQGASQFPPEFHPPKSIIECIERDLFILPGTILIRKELFLDVGGFDTDLIGYEDDHLFIRLFYKTKFGRTNLVGLFYRTYNNNTSMKAAVMCKSRILFYEKLKELVPDNPIRFWYPSRIYKARFARNIADEIKRCKHIKETENVRLLYDSYKIIAKNTWKYQIPKLFFHPNCPYFLFKFASSVASRLHIYTFSLK